MLIGDQGIRLNLMQKWDMNELDGAGWLHKAKPMPTILDIQERKDWGHILNLKLGSLVAW